MELLHFFPEYEDDSKIYWNFYFSGLLAYSLGRNHKDIDLEVSKLRGPQHKTGIDFVRGFIRQEAHENRSIVRIIILHDDDHLAYIGQREPLKSALKALIKQENLSILSVNFENSSHGSYFADEFFAEFLPSKNS